MLVLFSTWTGNELTHATHIWKLENYGFPHPFARTDLEVSFIFLFTKSPKINFNGFAFSLAMLQHQCRLIVNCFCFALFCFVLFLVSSYLPPKT